MSLRLVGLLVFFFTIMGKVVVGQDLIVRIYGDTIRCKIDQEDPRFIYYRIPATHRGETEIIARKEVRDIVYGGDPYSVKLIGPKISAKPFETVQFSVHAGYSWILRSDDLYGEDFEDVYDDMRGGVFIDGRLNYFLTEELGLGLVYSTSGYGSDPITVVTDTFPSGRAFSGPLMHDRTVNYYGVNLAYRLAQASSNVSVQVDVGLGLLTLEDRGTFMWDYRLKSTAIGGHLSGSFQLGLGEGFYLPAYVSLKGFSLSEYHVNPSPEMDPEVALLLQNVYDNLLGGITMARVQVGIGLGFAF